MKNRRGKMTKRKRELLLKEEFEMTKALRNLRGMQDLLPDLCARLNVVRDVGLRVASRYGYQEVL
jgi:hypothetical protein